MISGSVTVRNTVQREARAGGGLLEAAVGAAQRALDADHHDGIATTLG
ncbi:hypothetical protein [Nonomuraea dietziae]